MGDFENSTLAIILAVKKWPCLYDVNHENFKNTLSTETAWLAISEDIGIKIPELRNRWKSLKDCYVKHVRAKMSDPKIKTCYKNWRWAKYLHFLEPLSNYRSKNIIRLRPPKKKTVEISVIKSEPKLIEEAPTETDPTFSEVLVESSNYNQNYTEKDDIYHLFQSYAETFRKLTPKRQILLKIELAKLFSMTELEQLNEGDI